MAAETPFGTSFGNYGDPRKYMGQGQMPGQKIADKIKKVQASPLANVMGIMFAGDNQKPAPNGAVPSPAPVAPVGPVAPTIETSPAAPSIVAPEPAATQSQGVDADGDGVVDNFWGVPATPGKPVSDLSNPTDFNPTTQQAGYNMPLNTGNEYQQVPGYGKLAKVANVIFGRG
jgi:hypothetical protein